MTEYCRYPQSVIAIAFLHTLIQVFHRPNILVPSPEHKVCERENNRYAINKNIPVHEGWRRVRRHGEERKHKSNPEINDRDGVDYEPIFAEREAGGKKWLLAPSLDEHARAGDDIG